MFFFLFFFYFFLFTGWIGDNYMDWNFDLGLDTILSQVDMDSFGLDSDTTTGITTTGNTAGPLTSGPVSGNTCNGSGSGVSPGPCSGVDVDKNNPGGRLSLGGRSKTSFYYEVPKPAVSKGFGKSS